MDIRLLLYVHLKKDENKMLKRPSRTVILTRTVIFFRNKIGLNWLITHFLSLERFAFLYNGAVGINMALTRSNSTENFSC